MACASTMLPQHQVLLDAIPSDTFCAGCLGCNNLALGHTKHVSFKGFRLCCQVVEPRYAVPRRVYKATSGVDRQHASNRTNSQWKEKGMRVCMASTYNWLPVLDAFHCL
jgi:hypothetical protein